MVKKLPISSDLENQIRNLLSQEGLSSEDLEVILKGDYDNFFSHEEMESRMPSIFQEGEYGSIIQGIADGYSLEELPQKLGIRTNQIHQFQKILEEHHLSVDAVKAFNQYTDGSIILGMKRGVPKEQIFQDILAELDGRMKEYGFSSEQIQPIKEYVQNLDYSLPLHHSYHQTKEFLLSYGLSNKYVAVIQHSVKNLHAYYHIEETLASLDQGLKARLPKSMELYRAISRSFLEQRLKPGEDFTSLIGTKIEEPGYSSTSPLYDASFAKYDNRELVFDIYAPKGTQGISVMPFSSYGKDEQEVLLNANDLFITDIIPSVVDKNGQTKIVCKALLLSKDKSCYKGIGKEDKLPATELETDEEYFHARQEIKRILESLPREASIHSSFSVYPTLDQQERCLYKLEWIEHQERRTLWKRDFAYTEHFQKEMLKPFLIDFAKQTSISSTKLAPTKSQTPNQIKGTNSDVHLLGDNHHLLSVLNVDTAIATQIAHKLPQISPEFFSDSQTHFSQIR